MPEDSWWYNNSQNSEKAKAEFDFSEGKYHPEPKVVFKNRMVALKRWLEAREEKTIALVAHWGVLRALTGRDFENAEIYECSSDMLLQDDKLDLE